MPDSADHRPSGGGRRLRSTLPSQEVHTSGGDWPKIPDKRSRRLWPLSADRRSRGQHKLTDAACGAQKDLSRIRSQGAWRSTNSFAIETTPREDAQVDDCSVASLQSLASNYYLPRSSKQNDFQLSEPIVVRSFSPAFSGARDGDVPDTKPSIRREGASHFYGLS